MYRNLPKVEKAVPKIKSPEIKNKGLFIQSGGGYEYPGQYPPPSPQPSYPQQPYPQQPYPPQPYPPQPYTPQPYPPQNTFQTPSQQPSVAQTVVSQEDPKQIPEKSTQSTPTAPLISGTTAAATGATTFGLASTGALGEIAEDKADTVLDAAGQAGDTFLDR